MGVTQYVGARYVPHGWTDWNAETSYDALYVVKYNLAWYIAKKPVPVGTKPTCEKYWAMTDNWNGQVEEYRNEINAFMSNVDEKFIDTKNDIDNVYKKMSTPNSKKAYLLVGDSYGTIYTVGNDTITTTLPNFIKNITGLKIYSLFNGGHGFDPYTGNKYLTDLQNWVSSNAGIVNSITDIYMFGGANENDSSQLETEIYNVVHFIRANFKQTVNIKIGFYGVGMRNTDYNKRMYSVKNRYINSAIYNNCGLFTNLEKSFLNTTEICNDYVHPTQSGVNSLGLAIIGQMLGNWEPKNKSLSLTSNTTINNFAYKVIDNVGKIIGTFYGTPDNPTINNSFASFVYEVQMPVPPMNIGYGTCVVCMTNETESVVITAKTIFNKNTITVMVPKEYSAYRISGDFTITEFISF